MQPIYFAVVTLFFNEAMYLEEWLTFHHSLGIEHFLLYDYGSTDNFKDVLQPYITAGVAELHNANDTFPTLCSVSPANNEHVRVPCQSAVAAYAIAFYRKQQVRWIGFLDIAEFIFPLNGHSLISFVKSNEKYDVIKFKSAVYGGLRRDRFTRPSTLVIEKYLRRGPITESDSGWARLNNSQKTIVNPLVVNRSGAHDDECDGGCRSVEYGPTSTEIRMNRYQYAYDRNTSKFLTAELDPIAIQFVSSVEHSLHRWRNSNPNNGTQHLNDHLFPVDILANPEIIPQVCAAFLSCGRPLLLKRAVVSFISYMRNNEPNITYEIALLENGSGGDILQLITDIVKIDILIIARFNIGIAAGLNALFGSCRSPFILSLEEDWVARSEWPKHLPAIQMSIDILNHDQQVLEVWLRDFDYQLSWHQNRSAWVNTSTGIIYRRQYSQDGPGPFGLGKQWGAYTNGASLKHKSRLLSIGRFQGVNGELRYAGEVGMHGYASAHFCPLSFCDSSFSSDKWLFEHIGGEGRSPGHKIYEAHVGEHTVNW